VVWVTNMRRLRAWLIRLSGLWNKDRGELSDELNTHLQLQIEDNLRRGMAPEEARRQALIKLGSIAPAIDTCRDRRGIPAVETILRDIRHALRSLRKNLAFSTVAVITLALGIGANTAIFSAVKAVLLNQLPYRQPGRLVVLGQADSSADRPSTTDFTTTYDWRRLSHSFESMSLYRDAAAAIVEHGQAELVKGLRVNYDFFDTLGVPMQLGRNFLAEEDRPDRRFEVILSHGLWIRRFGADPNIVGRVIRLNEASVTVVGVLPAEFRPLQILSGDLPEMFLPLGYALSQPFACRGCQHLRLVARLKPGVEPRQAQAELITIMGNLKRQYPEAYSPKSTVALMPLHDYIVGPASTALWVLLGAVGLVLLIACANVASLMLARATSRTREIALRAALGAGRARLIRQLLTESLALSLAGGVAGVLLAWWGTTALASFAPKEIPRVSDIHMDAAVLLFGLAISLLTGTLFGLAPALRLSRTDLNDAFKDQGKATDRRSRGGLRNLLVAAEIALAFVLVVSAGLLGKSFLHLLNVNPGFDPHNVVTLRTYTYGARYQKPEAELAYYNQSLERLRATAGFESAAMTSNLPLVDSDRYAFHIRERHLRSIAEAPSVDTYSISSDYFRVLRIPLLRGRVFTDQDGPTSPKVAVISETCARQAFPNEDPIGKQIQLGGRADEKPWTTIVGVVGDIRHYGLDRAPEMATYIAQSQNMGFSFSLVARAGIDPGPMDAAAREAFLATDRTLPVFHVQSMETYLASTLAQRSFTFYLLGLFGACALLLAAIGIYGLISYAVTLRTREMGVRMAFGAGRGDVVWMVMRQSLMLIGIGLAAGFATSLAFTRLLKSLLFEVRPADLATWAAVAMILTIVALLASYLPARRAASVDPMIALRYE
jgi:putative ABC transport system permease protein